MRISNKFMLYGGGGAAVITALALCAFYYSLESVIKQVGFQTHREDRIVYNRLLTQIAAAEAATVSTRLEHESRLLRSASMLCATPRTPEETRRILVQVLDRSACATGLFLKFSPTDAPAYEFYLGKNPEQSQKTVFRPYSELPSWSVQKDDKEAAYAAFPIDSKPSASDEPAFVLIQRLRNSDGVEQGTMGLLFPANFLKGILPHKMLPDSSDSSQNWAALSSGKGQVLTFTADNQDSLEELKAGKIPSPGQILALGGRPVSTRENSPLICENTLESTGELYSAATLTALPVISSDNTQWFYQRHFRMPSHGNSDPALCSAQKSVFKFFITVSLLVLAGLLLFIAELAYVSKLIVSPLRQALVFSNDLAKGNFNATPIKINSNDEIGELIKSLNFMRDRLQNLISKIKSSHEREKEARQDAEAANHLKSDFLANMSLELRNPLNSIMGFSTLILKDAERGHYDDELRRKAKTIFTSAEALNSLITNLLELSRIDSSQIELSPSEVRTSEFMRELVDCNSLAASEKCVSLENHFSADIPATIVIDRDILFHILCEITGALIKTAAPGSTVSLGCRKVSDETLIFRAWDSKSKRNSESLAELYNKYIAKKGTELFPSLHGAAMLSLALANSNAQLLGAEFKASSAEDADSSFELSFHLAELTPPPMETEETSSIHSATNWDKTRKSHSSHGQQQQKTKSPGRTLSILLAEDNNENRLLIEMMLANTPCKLDSVVDGVACLEALSAQKYDILLLDLQMPKLDGFAVIDRLRADEKFNAMPIIVLTAYIEEGDKEKLRTAGANECLLKPLNIDELLSAIRNLS